MNYLTSENGKPIKNTNPLPTQLVDADGNPHPFEVDENGYLKVNTNITSVTATDVTIHDPVTSANKLVVNPDGTIGVQVSGCIPECAWLDGGSAPTPIDPSKFAWGYKFNATNGAITAYGWSGSAWVEVI